MKLVKCHIEGFGKIRNKDISFEDGVNVICESNGFGKTTLATFLKTMFYGFEDETKRNLKDKEREKYRPWDKGTYGGSIVFENEGKTYEVSRTFGKNTADDSFDLRNYDTNAESKDYSKEDLGTGVFGIDKASFFRTTYFASKDREISGENITDSIRAKLGNLTDATDDINNYENVCAKLDALKNDYTPDRKTGKIKATKVQIVELGNELRERANVDKSIEVLENQIVSEHGKLERNKGKLVELREETKKLGEAESKKAKRETYETLRSEYNESVKNASDAIALFQGRVPTQAEVEEISLADVKNAQLINTMNESRFHKDDEWNKIAAVFDENPLNENDISEMIAVWNEREKAQSNNDYLLRLREDAVKRYVEEEKNRIIKENEENLKLIQSVNAKRKSQMLFCITMAVLTLCAGLIGGGMTHKADMAIHIGVSAGGILLCAVFSLIIPLKKVYKREGFTQKDENSVKPEDASKSSKEVEELDTKISDNNEILSQKENEVKAFLSKYQENFDEKNVTVDLFKLSEKLKRYGEGKSKLAKYEATNKEYEEVESNIESFFAAIGVKEGDNRAETIAKLREALLKRDQFEAEMQRKKIKLENFEADNNIDEILKEDEQTVKDRDDIEDEIAEIDEENDRTKALIENFRMKLSDEQEKREELIQKEIKVGELKEELKEYEDLYRIMELTKNYLTKAKDELSLKYTGPTMTAFRKYCSYFDRNGKDDFRIDTNFNLTKLEEGMQRDMKDLSFGLRDVADFCLRLAFTDAMYEGEKPFLILDDPFVNFDKDNLEAARMVLNKVSDNYQIIYFTCHESRGGVTI